MLKPVDSPTPRAENASSSDSMRREWLRVVDGVGQERFAMDSMSIADTNARVENG